MNPQTLYCEFSILNTRPRILDYTVCPKKTKQQFLGKFLYIYIFLYIFLYIFSLHETRSDDHLSEIDNAVEVLSYPERRNHKTAISDQLRKKFKFRKIRVGFQAEAKSRKVLTSSHYTILCNQKKRFLHLQILILI